MGQARSDLLDRNCAMKQPLVLELILIVFWPLRTVREPERSSRGQSDSVSSVTFSHEPMRLASATPRHVITLPTLTFYQGTPNLSTTLKRTTRLPASVNAQPNRLPLIKLWKTCDARQEDAQSSRFLLSQTLHIITQATVAVSPSPPISNSHLTT